MATKSTTPTAEMIKKEFQLFCHEFIDLKRLFETQDLILRQCSGKTIKDDIAYKLILFSSIEGLVLRITNFTESFLDYLDKTKSSCPRVFGVSEWNAYLARLKTSDSYLYQIERKSFAKIKKRIFPHSDEWKAGRPSAKDFDELKQRLYDLYKPIKDHRDTVVAHKDKKAINLEIKSVKVFLADSEIIFQDLYQMAFCVSYIFQFGGVARRPETSAKKLAKACLTF